MYDGVPDGWICCKASDLSQVSLDNINSWNWKRTTKTKIEN